MLLAIAATVLCYRAFHTKYDNTLKNAVTTHLRQLFPDCSVYVGYVSQNGGSLTATDVLFANKGGASRNPILKVERVVVRGNLDLTDWLHNRIEVKQLELFGVHLNVWQNAAGDWSFDHIKPCPNPTSVPPRLVFNDASVTIHKLDGGSPSPATASIDFNNISGFAEHTWEGPPEARYKVLRAQVSGRSPATVANFHTEVVALSDVGDWKVKGNFEDLRLSQALIEGLPDSVAESAAQIKGLTCQATAHFEASGKPGQAPQFSLAGKLHSGSLRDPRLTYRLENVRGEFSCDNSRIQLRDMLAQSGATELEIDADIYGLSPNSPLTLHAKVANLELDQALYQSLPKKLKDGWDKLQLEGKISGTVKLAFDGKQWTPELDAVCQGVAVRAWLFPYPIDEIYGRVTYNNATLSTPQQIVGRAGGQTIHGTFSLNKLETTSGQTDWTGHLACRADGPVAIDELLISSLTPRGRSTSGAETFVRSLDTSGTIQLSLATFDRRTPQDIWHKSIDANVYSGHINYELFRYPIYDVRGRILCDDSRWWLEKFEGRNDSGRIQCKGNWETPPSGPVPFDLTFDAFDIPIEEELKQALPSETQFVWDELQPLGAIDNVQVSLSRLALEPQVRTSVNIIENRRNNNASGRSLRLMPKAFPYLLSDVDCKISYSPGLVRIWKASGLHDGNEIAISGQCEPVEDGRWKATTAWLPTTRVRIESELLKALPKSIRESLVRIDFRGPISVVGNSEITFADSRSGNIETAWDCNLDIENGQLGDGRYIGSMRGMIKMRGQSKGSTFNAVGSVGLDALTVMGVPVTRLNGPFAVIGSKLYFGSDVSNVLPQSQFEPFGVMSANSLSGTVELSGYGQLETGNFHLESSLRSAKLDLLLKDLGVEKTSAEAVCDAELNFDGVPWDPQGYSGDGKIELTEAKLYELPFMIRLMNATAVAEDDSAFQTANIEFRLDGDQIPLTKIHCDGEVLRLRGEGWTNLRRELKLDLHMHIGRRFPIGKVVQPLFPDSRFASFMSINVTGTLDNPIMNNQVFPQFAVETLFPESSENKPASFWQRGR